MKKGLLSVFVLFLFVSLSFSQNKLDAYKYVIIPQNYDFLKEADEYKVNSLTKFLFDKRGYNTIFEGESYPSDLLGNPCLAVTVDVKSESNMLTTKLTIVLSDCYDKVVFTCVQGKSREKDYNKTYSDALRKSFVSIENLNYNYNPELIINSKDTIHTEITTAAVKTEEPKPVVKTEAPKAVVVPVVTETNKEPVDIDVEDKKEETIARSYKNENISFFLIEQNNELVAYVNESNNEAYKKGEKIGTFIKTSLPNVFRVSWKNKQNDIDETTAYFDETGNLKIDVNRNGKIEVLVFEQENP